MKSKLSAVLIFSLFLNIALAEDIPLGRAAELACHRIERLVTLRKIEESYLNNFSSLKIDLLAQENSEAPRFKVVGFEFGGEAAKQIILNLNNDGRAQSHTLVEAPDSIGPVWTGKDPVTLVENSLHYVIENGPSNPGIAPYLLQLSELHLVQVTVDGQSFAKVEMKNLTDSKTLIIWLNFEGEFIRYEIVM